MAVSNAQALFHGAEKPFTEEYFPEIAFTVAAVAFFVFSPLTFTLGTGATFAFHYYMYPEMKLGRKEKIVTIPNTIFAIVGAVGALVSLTPAGVSGSLAFKATQLLAPYAFGTTAFRVYKSG